jgi:hypothetical protein
MKPLLIRTCIEGPTMMIKEPMSTGWGTQCVTVVYEQKLLTRIYEDVSVDLNFAVKYAFQTRLSKL